MKFPHSSSNNCYLIVDSQKGLCTGSDIVMSRLHLSTTYQFSAQNLNGKLLYFAGIVSHSRAPVSLGET